MAQTITPDATPRRIIRQPAVVERVGVSSTTLWRWYRAGKFPRPVKLGEHSIGWFESDIEAWFTERAASR